MEHLALYVVFVDGCGHKHIDFPFAEVGNRTFKGSERGASGLFR